MRLLLALSVIALFGINYVRTDDDPTTTLSLDEIAQTTTEPVIEAVSHSIPARTDGVEDTGTCSSCATIAEETSLDTKDTNPCEYGECVPYYLCLNGSIITSGEGILDVRIGAEDDPEPERHPCPDFFDTCCLLRSTNGPVTGPVQGHVGGPAPVATVTPYVDPDKGIPLTPTQEPIVKADKCGIRNKKGTVFEIIARENEAQYAEFPWTVAVIYKVHDNADVVNVYKCGGSLIHPMVVMTAAHCVIDLNNVHDIMIRAGEWDTQTNDEPYPHQDRPVIEVITHVHYRRGSHFNDIALLILDKPVELAENVNTACLPPQDYVFDHQRCFATGWGKDKFGKDGAYQVILKRVELPVVPSDECQVKLRETRLGRHFILDSSFICAGGEKGKDTCQGDGGAPLNCEMVGNAHGQYYVAGEVAWGIGCFDTVPGVYVNVAKFSHWVDKIFNERNYDKKYYTADNE